MYANTNTSETVDRSPDYRGARVLIDEHHCNLTITNRPIECADKYINCQKKLLSVLLN